MAAGHDVRALVRDRGRASRPRVRGRRAARGRRDRRRARWPAPARASTWPTTWCTAWAAGREGDFEQTERESAANFARMARDAGVERVVYLGGLGDDPGSKHLRSRNETGRILGEEGPPLTYFRASMVVGAKSESYLTLRHLVQKLPVMIAPSWLKTKTQPIAVDDVLDYLAAAPEVDGRRPRGADRLPRRGLLRRDAGPDGRRAGPPPPAQDPRARALPLAVLALDRPGHARRRGRGQAADRGPVHRDHGHRPLGRRPVRHRADGNRRGAAATPWPKSGASRFTSTLSAPRAVAQPGSALRSGRRGPQFKSGQPDSQAATAL